MLHPSNEYSNSEISTAYEKYPRFIEWEPDTTLVVVPHRTLKQAGWKQVKYPVHRVVAASFLDLQTGEIIKKRDMYTARNPVPNNPGMRLIQQLCIINSLDKRARDLCVFLLRMRNFRGSFVVQLSDLVDGYIRRNGPVKRMARAREQHGEIIGRIAGAGVIANELALGSLFQKHGATTPQAVLEEAAVWYGWPGIFAGQTGFEEVVREV